MPFITTREAAARLGVTQSRVRAMIRQGNLQSEKGGTRDHLIDEAELVAYSQRTRPPGRPTLEETAEKLGIAPEELREQRKKERRAAHTARQRKARAGAASNLAGSDD